jgi:hypothetical protein
MLDVKSTTSGMLVPRMTLDQRNAISAPAEGLMVFCTNCGMNGALSLFTGGSWRTFSSCLTPSPTAGTHVPSINQIVWNWNAVTGALGYKWSTTNNYTTATDMGALLTKTQTSLAMATVYTSYAWAYFDCGTSLPLTMMGTTQSCGGSLVANHVQSTVVPVTKSVTYGTVTGVPGEPGKCWITSNLGADHQATAVNDATEPSAGWYWQFNRIRGFKHDGSQYVPLVPWNSTINENSDWQGGADPCAILLGNPWRIPTDNEWANVDGYGGWTNWNGPWNSLLKLHAAGLLSSSIGALFYRGSLGYYWSRDQNNLSTGNKLEFTNGYSVIGNIDKAVAMPLRCIR